MYSTAASSCHPTFVPRLNKSEHAMNAPLIRSDGHCFAFIATGSYTKGARSITHNNWPSYAELVGDRKTGEIAYLELGLKNTPVCAQKTANPG